MLDCGDTPQQSPDPRTPVKVPLQSLSRVALAVLALSMTVSCLPGSGPFARRTLVTDGAAVVDGASAPGARAYRAPVVASTGFFFGSSRGYYDRGYGYGSRSLCSTCGYNPCRCSSRYRHGTGHGGSYRSRPSSSGHDHSKHPHAHDTYAIAGGSVRPTQTKPSGFHSLDWYKSRGYDTSRLKLVNEHGQPKGHSQSKSKSSSGSSSSGSKSKSSSSRSSSKGSSSKSSGSSSSKKQGGHSRR